MTKAVMVHPTHCEACDQALKKLARVPFCRPCQARRCKGRDRAKQRAARRAWTPERRAAWGERMRARFDSTGFMLQRGDLWQPAEDALLRSLAGTLPIGRLVATFNERSPGLYRAKSAIQSRLQKLGESQILAVGLTAEQARSRLGVGRDVLYAWCESGQLRAVRESDKPHARWIIQEADLVAFVRANPHELTLRCIRDRHLRSEAETALRAQRLLSIGEAAAYLGMAYTAVATAIWRGRLPVVRGRYRTYVRAADLVQFMARREAA